VAIVIVVVFVPIALCVPTVAVFVPPAMVVIPATFACFLEFVASMIGLPAVPTMVLDGLVHFVVGLGNAPLTTAIVIVVVGESARGGRERQQTRQRCDGQNCTSQKLLLSGVLEHGFSILS
jgi:hypothetical protein